MRIVQEHVNYLAMPDFWVTVLTIASGVIALAESTFRGPARRLLALAGIAATGVGVALFFMIVQ